MSWWSFEQHGWSPKIYRSCRSYGAYSVQRRAFATNMALLTELEMLLTELEMQALLLMAFLIRLI